VVGGELAHRGTDQGLLGAEVVVHLAVVHTGAPRDLAEPGVAGTHLGEEVRRCLDQRRLDLGAALRFACRLGAHAANATPAARVSSHLTNS